ncbi:MAG: ATP-binding protein [Phascolarctobacterium sp.]
MFLCREKELAVLNKRYQNQEFECIIIYGRRRVGKTALMNQFCQDKPTIFFSALNASEKENLTALSKAIYTYKTGLEANYPIYQSFDAALEEITQLSAQQRMVLIIDEYPYLAKSYPSISSRLQHLIDHKWQQSKLYLILCGSSMSFMENQVLGYESPLYGRRTAQLKIMPLTYKDTATFVPQLSFQDKALIYGITGGIPHYINKLQVQDTVEEALKTNLFDSSSYLFEEPQNLLKQELREPGVYNSIITAIATGASRINEIATKAGLENAACAKYIKVLLELGILVKETPITEKVGKKSIYLIGDNFFRFWYRFVPANYSAINAGRFPAMYAYAVKPYLATYMGLVFENMCKDYLLRYATFLPIPLANIGQWWGTDNVAKKEVQIDIVGTSANSDEYLIGSCKYKNEKIGMDELMLLHRYAQVFGKGSKYHYYIFSKGGFTKELQEAAARNEVTLVTLEDLYQ